MSRLDAAHVHSVLGRAGWPPVLVRLGVDESFLRDRHGPCPVCGGKDRFRFDHEKRGKGSFYCTHCSPGDGFKLLMLVRGWDFRTALAEVAGAAGITADSPSACPLARAPVAPEAPAKPTPRILEMLRTACDPADVSDVRAYLESRKLWPLPPGHGLRAHVGASYYDGKTCIGRFPAIVAPIVDINGELVGCHLTWLRNGKKLEGHAPRKILGKLAGWAGCAVQLLPATDDTLGIAEGIETALSAAALDGLPVWSALNAAQLAKFKPPPNVKRVRVYGDRDEAGMGAALKLVERLQGRVCVETRIPTAPAKDWNDVLIARGAK